LSRDQKFFDMYTLILGVVGAVALAFIVLAMKMADLTQGVYTRDTAEYQQALIERIKPKSEVYLPGEEHAASAPTVDTPEQPDPVATMMTGPQVYNSACSACHGAGIGGAPILGDAAQWVERIARGNDVLKQHAIEGYTGSTGFMPAKGGSIHLSDAEVESAVEFMVGEAN
jgi:cytochrome c5